VDISIRELAELIQSIVDVEVKINWNTSMPDGTPKKLLDVSKLHLLGWSHKISLEDGIKDVYEIVKEKL
jgi:GDP-L-fucose synthase